MAYITQSLILYKNKFNVAFSPTDLMSTAYTKGKYKGFKAKLPDLYHTRIQSD